MVALQRRLERHQNGPAVTVRFWHAMAMFLDLISAQGMDIRLEAGKNLA
jgi:hypothetical protein